jgi:hypothetical protein
VRQAGNRGSDIFTQAILVKRAEESMRLAYGRTLAGDVPEHVSAAVRKSWDSSRSALKEIRIAVQNGKVVPFPGARSEGEG